MLSTVFILMALLSSSRNVAGWGQTSEGIGWPGKCTTSRVDGILVVGRCRNTKAQRHSSEGSLSERRECEMCKAGV